MEETIGTPIDPIQQDVEKLATGASISLFGKIGGRGIYTLVQIALARMLAPELFGLYALGWTILNIGGLIANLGLHNGVIHLGSLYWQKDDRRFKQIIYQSIGYSLLGGFIAGLVLYLSAPWLAEQLFSKPDLAPVLRWFSPIFPLSAGLKAAAAATRIPERMKFTVYAEDLLQPIANLGLLVLVYALGGRIIGMVAACVVSFALAFLLAIYYVVSLFRKELAFPANLSGGSIELIRYSTPTAVSSLFTTLIIWIDRILVGYFLPASAVGIYQAASQSALLFAIILTGFNTIFTPMIARLYNSENKERLENLFRVSTKWGLYISIPFFLVVIFAPVEFIQVIFGKEYAPGALPLIILAAAQLINAGTGAVGNMLIMTGHQNRWLAISTSMFFFNLIFNFYMTPRYGIIGTAIATASAVSVLYLLALLQVRLDLQLWPYDRRYLKGILATAVTIIAILLYNQMHLSGFLHLFLLTVISILVFSGVLLLLGLDQEDKDYIRTIQSRLRRAKPVAQKIGQV